MEKTEGNFRRGLFGKTLLSIVRLLWQVSISVKFAVVVMVCLTLCLIIATILESMYDTPTAQYWVYQTRFFFGLLGLLFWLILCVALSRLPWQRRHLPFLCAHAGIILLLYGSWLTFQFGVDGSMQIEEGKTESAVEINEPLLLISTGQEVKSIPVPWLPPNAKFKPIAVPEYGLTVVDYISRAEPKVSFLPSTDSRELAQPAIRVKVAGGKNAPPFMRMGQESWLWAGDPAWSRVQAGGASLTVLPRMPGGVTPPAAFEGKSAQAVFRLGTPKKGEKSAGQLDVILQRSDGSRKVVSLPFKDPKELVGKVIETGWKFDATLTVLEWIPGAISEISYSPSRVQFGQNLPPSAIRVKPDDGGPGAWLGLGERASFEKQGMVVAKAKSAAKDVRAKAKSAVASAKKKAQSAVDTVKSKAKDASAKAKDVAGKAKDLANDARAKAKGAANDAASKAKDVAGQAKSKAKDVADQAKDIAKDARAKAKGAATDAATKAKGAAKKAKQITQDAAEDVAERAGDAADDVREGGEGIVNRVASGIASAAARVASFVKREPASDDSDDERDDRV